MYIHTGYQMTRPTNFIYLKVYVYTHAHYIPESRIVSNQINTAWG